MDTECDWQPTPPELAEDTALSAAVVEVHQALLDGPLARDPMLNHRLSLQERALRRIEDWRVLLLLTPWMLARLLFPDRPPEWALPSGWAADERGDADYQILGPSLTIELLGHRQQAHLNHHPRLGHYLIQPLCLNMDGYADADAVFESWNQVIRTRDENMERAKRDCAMQREISRRELFRRLKPDA